MALGRKEREKILKKPCTTPNDFILLIPAGFISYYSFLLLVILIISLVIVKNNSEALVESLAETSKNFIPYKKANSLPVLQLLFSYSPNQIYFLLIFYIYFLGHFFLFLLKMYLNFRMNQNLLYHKLV